MEKKAQGLNVMAKGTKELAGGRRLHLMVVVAYGKGVVLCQPYEKLNGCFFVQFIRQHFNITFAKAGAKPQSKRIFVMDNDPSQTSKNFIAHQVAHKEKGFVYIFLPYLDTWFILDPFVISVDRLIRLHMKYKSWLRVFVSFAMKTAQYYGGPSLSPHFTTCKLKCM